MESFMGMENCSLRTGICTKGPGSMGSSTGKGQRSCHRGNNSRCELNIERVGSNANFISVKGCMPTCPCTAVLSRILQQFHQSDILHELLCENHPLSASQCFRHVVIQGKFASGKYHGIGSLETADGRVYSGVSFVGGELQHSALQLQLEYPKTVNKKNVELPVSMDIGSVIPAEFSVSVRILCEAQDPDAEDGAQPAATHVGLQTMAAESGRTVYLHLQQGHEDLDGSGQPLQQPVFKPQHHTPTPPGGAATTQDGEGAETPAGLQCLCAVTAAGECSFQGFQIGGEGLAVVEPGPYTLVISSQGLADERILVQLSQPKGKKK